jgi:pimeloyl-ACP methyl ester carboxylesterase
MANVKPIIVLLPGLDGTGVLFAALLTKIQLFFEVIVITYPTNQKLSYENIIDYVMDRMPRNQPCVVLGESFAGPIALYVAAAGVHEVLGVILCASFARHPWCLFKKLNRLFLIIPIQYIRKLFIIKWLVNRQLGKELSKKIDDALNRVDPDVIQDRLRYVLEMDATQSLKKITMPLLYMQATHDVFVPQRAFNYLSKYKDDIELHKFPTHHFLLQSMPDEAAEVIKTFVQRLWANV